MNYIIKNLFNSLQKNYVFFSNFRKKKINYKKKHNKKIYLSNILNINSLNYFSVFKYLKKILPLFLINSKNSLVFSFNSLNKVKNISILKNNKNYNIIYISIFKRLINFSKFEKIIKNKNIFLKNILNFIIKIYLKKIYLLKKIFGPFTKIKKNVK